MGPAIFFLPTPSRAAAAGILIFSGSRIPSPPPPRTPPTINTPLPRPVPLLSPDQEPPLPPRFLAGSERRRRTIVALPHHPDHLVATWDHHRNLLPRPHLPVRSREPETDRSAATADARMPPPPRPRRRPPPSTYDAASTTAGLAVERLVRPCPRRSSPTTGAPPTTSSSRIAGDHHRCKLRRPSPPLDLHYTA